MGGSDRHRGPGPLAQGTGFSKWSDPDAAALYANSSDFHDVTTGFASSGAKKNSAGTGYDLVTGLGTPKAAALIQALVGWTGGASPAKSGAVAVSSPKGGAKNADSVSAGPIGLNVGSGPGIGQTNQGVGYTPYNSTTDSSQPSVAAAMTWADDSVSSANDGDDGMPNVVTAEGTIHAATTGWVWRKSFRGSHRS